MDTLHLKCTDGSFGEHLMLEATSKGLRFAFHLGNVAEERLEEALETDDAWIVFRMQHVEDALLSDYQPIAGDFYGLPSLDPTIKQLRELADKLEAVQAERVKVLGSDSVYDSAADEALATREDET